eukprot:Gb_18089 [translate_table: standard]
MVSTGLLLLVASSITLQPVYFAPSDLIRPFSNPILLYITRPCCLQLFLSTLVPLCSCCYVIYLVLPNLVQPHHPNNAIPHLNSIATWTIGIWGPYKFWVTCIEPFEGQLNKTLIWILRNHRKKLAIQLKNEKKRAWDNFVESITANLVHYSTREHPQGGYEGESLDLCLAAEPGRSKYFREEIFSALSIIEQGHGPPGNKRLEGSYAGAMGQCQFMPSSFLFYAVDYDGDGRTGTPQDKGNGKTKEGDGEVKCKQKSPQDKNRNNYGKIFARDSYQGHRNKPLEAKQSPEAEQSLEDERLLKVNSYWKWKGYWKLKGYKRASKAEPTQEVEQSLEGERPSDVGQSIEVESGIKGNYNLIEDSWSIGVTSSLSMVEDFEATPNAFVRGISNFARFQIVAR